MSIIKMTKTFEIDKNGSCTTCKERISNLCYPFKQILQADGFVVDNENDKILAGFKQCQQCKDFLKAEAQPEKTCTLDGLECRILWNSKGEPDQLMISFNAENKNRLINAYSKRDIAKLVLKILECEV